MNDQVETRGGGRVPLALLALVAGLAAGRETRPAAPAAGAASAEPCLRETMGPRGLSTLVADAVAVLRRAGHEPSDYVLEFEAASGGEEPSLVFLPRGDGRLYAVAVRPEDPCALRWVWRPDRWTAWQNAVVERAVELLRASAPAPGAEMIEVAIVETSETVTVRVRYADPAQPGSAGSESQVTLPKAGIDGSGD